jgi:uncharacterized glyoxalase superfamily protein PhnB
MTTKIEARPGLYPFIRYADAPAAMRWLATAFGFEEHMVVPGENGTIAHAELKLGPDMIMIGSQREDRFRMRAPGKDGYASQGCYMVVDDIDAHYKRAAAAGAEIIQALADTDYGSREYAVRDPEGHFWSFGTYRPE